MSSLLNCPDRPGQAESVFVCVLGCQVVARGSHEEMVAEAKANRGWAVRLARPGDHGLPLTTVAIRYFETEPGRAEAHAHIHGSDKMLATTFSCHYISEREAECFNWAESETHISYEMRWEINPSEVDSEASSD